ncbi:MAG: Uma2 family endonuclease [Dehalococcoidia bacterium]
MTAAAPHRLMTADELFDLPDNGTLYELSRGTLICMSPSSYGPSQIAGAVIVRVGSFIEQNKLGEFGTAEGGFKLTASPDTVRAPDVWFVRAKRVPPGENRERFYDGPPDLAIEILSPSDRFHHVMLKVRDYMEANTPLLWVLDPKSKITAVFRSGSPVRFVDIDGVLDGEDVLPGFTLPLRDVLR